MPEMNGVETYRAIKELSPDTHGFMITGYGKEYPLVEEAISEGIENILHKPCDMELLLRLIRSSLDSTKKP